MHITRGSWLSAAKNVDWFRLDRHDEDPASTAPTPEAPEEPSSADAPQEPSDPDPADEPDDDDPEPEGAKKLGDAGKRALDKLRQEKAAAKKEAAEERRKAAALAKKVEEFELRDKSELDREKAKTERLAQQATKATARAVQAEVRALSTGMFADPTDAAEVLMRDPAQYVDDSGDIDTDAIQTALDDLLERKPHWARPEPAADPAPAAPQKPRPKPDPGQGARPTSPPTDFRNASTDELHSELLAKYNFRPRWS